MARTINSGYMSYSFKDHDPILDMIDALIDLASIDARRTIKMAEISRNSGVGLATLYSWRARKTKRPQSASVHAVVIALGGKVTMTYRGREVKLR